MAAAKIAKWHWWITTSIVTGGTPLGDVQLVYVPGGRFVCPILFKMVILKLRISHSSYTGSNGNSLGNFTHNFKVLIGLKKSVKFHPTKKKIERNKKNRGQLNI